MKQLLFLFLFPCLCVAQYTGNGNQKITLGEQSTADGLVFRGLAADTTRKPSVDTMAYILLDTNTNIIWQYKKATNNAWTRVGGSISSGVTGTLPVANGGTNTNTAFTAGSVIFAGASGTYSQDNSNLFYDNTNDRLGLLTSTPRTILDVKSVKLNSAKLGSGFGVALFENDVTNDDTPDYQAFAIQNTLRYRGTQGTNNTTRGIIANINSAFNYSTGTVEEMSGFYLDLRNLSTGTITNAYGMKIINFENSSGTITNKYGFYSDIANSGATNKWNIYVNGAAPNYFNGTTTFASLAGTGSRAVLADVNGVLSAPVSSITTKENVQTLNYGLNEILQINPVSFDYINKDKWGDERNLGFIIEDMFPVVPEVTGTMNNGDMYLDMTKLIPILTKAIQEQQALIKALEQRILTLENK